MDLNNKVAQLADKSTQMLEDFERSNIRAMMQDAYSCASKCASDKVSSKSKVDGCISQCFKPFEQAQTVITNEMNAFQDRLQRCAQSCEDNMRDKYEFNSDKQHMNSVQKTMEDCISKCCDDHVDVLTNTMDRIKRAVESIRPPSAYM